MIERAKIGAWVTILSVLEASGAICLLTSPKALFTTTGHTWDLISYLPREVWGVIIATTFGVRIWGQTSRINWAILVSTFVAGAFWGLVGLSIYRNVGFVLSVSMFAAVCLKNMMLLARVWAFGSKHA